MALSRDQLQRFNSQRPQQGNAQQPQRRMGAMESALASGRQDDSDGGFVDTATDIGVDLAQGALRLPGAAAGLADIPTAAVSGRTPVSDATSAIGEATGFQPGEWADSLDRFQSDALKEQQANVSEAFEGTGTAFTEGRWGDAFEGMGRGALALAQNPRALGSTVTESLPLMAAGGGMGRLLTAAGGTRATAPTLQNLQRASQPATQRVGQAVATGQAGRQAADIARTIPQRARINPIVAAGAGEGMVIGGMQMDELIDNPDVDPQIAALASLAAGAGGGALGVGGGALAQRLGVVNPEQAFMGRAGRTQPGPAASRPRRLPARIAGGFVSEGVFEEMPQETLETITSNWAEGEPLLSNVPRAMVEGMMAGGVMGGAFGFARPRTPNALPEPSNLTDRSTPEVETPAGQQTFQAQDAGIPEMLRYHRRLTRVATQSQEPDLQDEAINRMDAVMQELDNRGIPREIVERETAKQRYKETKLSLNQMQQQYRNSLLTDPERARGYLEKARAQAQELQQLEDVYGAAELETPDLATIQTLQNVEGTEGYFRRNGRLKKGAQTRLDQYLDMEPEDLARAIQNDLTNEESGAGSVDNYAPMRRVVAEQRQITPDFITETAQNDAGADLRQQREETQLAAPNVTNAEDPNALEGLDQYDDAATEPVDRMTRFRQQFQQAMGNMSPERKRVFEAMKEVAQDAGRLGAVRNIAESVGQKVGKSQANVKNTMRQMFDKLTSDLEVENTGNLTMNQFFELMIEADVSGARTTQAATDEDITVFEEADDSAPTTTPNVDPVDPTESYVAGGGAAGVGILNSPGGSQGQVDPVVARALDNDDPRSSPEYRALTSEATRALREFERGLTTAQQQTVDDHAEAEAQLQEAIESSADEDTIATLQATVERLAQELPASVKRAHEMAELQRQEEEAGQAAAQRRAERQAEADQQLNSAMGAAAGEAWNKRAAQEFSSIWPSDTPPPSWAELVESDSLTAYAWLEIMLDMLNAPRTGRKDALNRAFTETVQEIENDRRTEEVTGQPRYTGPDPVQRGTTGPAGSSTDQSESRTGQSTAQAPTDGAAQTGEPGFVTDPVPKTENGFLADESGQPMTLYHGTGGARGAAGQFMPVGELDPALLGSNTGASSAQQGFFFSSSAENASMYASRGPARGLVDAFAIVRNINNREAQGVPLTPSAQSRRSNAQRMIDAAMAEGRIKSVNLRMRDPLVYDYAGVDWSAIRDTENTQVPSLTDLIGQAKANGNDGVIMRNINDPLPGDNYVVFEPSQVRDSVEERVEAAAESDLEPDTEGLQARRQRLGQTLQELYVQNPSPDIASAMTTLARAQDDALPDALDAAEAVIDAQEGAAPSTQATEEAPAPVVRRRGRRQPIDANTLRPAQGATDEQIQESIDAASDPDSGPQALSQLNVLMHEARDARTEERIGRSPVAQAQAVRRGIALVTNPQSTVQQVLDMTNELAQGNPGLQALIAELRTHPSIQNVRFLAEPLADATDAFGQYYSDVHGVYINEVVYESYARHVEEGFRPPSFRPDNRLAETIVHELVHAASVRLIQTNEKAVFDALVPLSDELISYVNNNKSLFTAEELGLLQIMMADPAEIVTYTLTSKDMQHILTRIPSSQPRNKHFLARVVDAIMGMLGLQQHSGTMLEAMAEATGSLFEMDAAYTRQNFESVRNVPQDTWDLRVGDIAYDLGYMASYGWETDGFYDALSQYVEQADAATMAGDTEARVQALDGISRVSESVRQHAARLGASSRPQRQTLRPLAQAVQDASFSNRIYDASVARAPAPVRNWLTAAKNTIRRLPQAAMFSHDFVDYVKKSLPQVEAYFSSVFHRLSERNNHHVAIQKIVDPVSKFTAQQRDQMNAVLRTSAYSEKWAFKPAWLSDNIVPDPALERDFNALPQEAQDVVKEMFEYAYKSNQEVQRQLRADIVTTFDSLIEKAKRDKQKDKLRRDKAAALAEHDNRQIDRTTPYLPLKRWGEWAVVHKSQKFKQAEIAKNRKEVNQLKSDPQHYQVVFAENEFQALQERDRMADDLGVKVEAPFQRMRYEQSNEAIPFDLLQRLRTEAMGDAAPSKMSPTELRISSAIDRLYIEALEESSVRKSELRRLKVEGAGRDMVRAFVEHGQGLVALSSAMRLNKETRSVIQQMKTHATDPTNVKDRPRRMEALNEVLARHALAIDIDSRDTIQQKVMGYTSIWMLLTNPAYYIQNATQPFMLTLPVLSARFGMNKSMGVMRRAYQEVMATRRMTEGKDLIDPMKLADPMEQELFTRLQRLNLLDVGIAADLGSIRENRGVMGRTLGAAHRKMLTAVRTVEVYNRGVTAISGYRLNKQRLEAARDRGENKLSDSAIVEQAKQYAMKLIQTTQGDYSGPNAPRLISMLPAGRVLTQFRKFQLIQIGLLTRTVHQMFRGTSAEEKAIGRKQMAYILGMHGIIGGAMGLPAANIIGYALAHAFGDDDEPKNAELLARRAMQRDGVGREVQDLILKGLPTTFGLDASNRLGMGLTFSIMPFADISPGRDGFNTILANILGPSVGLASQMYDGASQIQQGNIAAGLPQMMPSVLKNAMRAYLYKTDGVRLRNGDLAMSAEELSWYDTATVGIGWPSQTITDRYFGTGALRDVQEHFRSRTTKIKKAYVAGFESGDSEAMQTAREAWRDLQQMRRQYKVGNPQPLSNLLRAPREQDEREELMVQGVPTQNTTRRFVEELFE